MPEYNLDWKEEMTPANVEKIGAMLRQLLRNKTYVFVFCSEIIDYKPLVTVGLRLAGGDAGIKCFAYPEKNLASISIADTGGVFTCQLVQNLEDKITFKKPVFHFERNQVTVTHRAPSGNLIYWVIAVQPDMI
ncbi:MAG: hypothetical protein WC310_04270 [Patescibacteria group bacterium]|jgi:hypothetical protein